MTPPILSVPKSWQFRQPTSVFVFATFALVLLTSSCAQSQELTRSHALSLIRESKDFKEPVTISLKSNNDIPVQAKSEKDLEPEAQAQAVEAFLGDHPEMAVLRHLGLVEVKATTIKRPISIKPLEFPVKLPIGTTAKVSPRLPNKFEPWRFKVETMFTEKGKQLVGETQGGASEAIPIFQREVIEVTGVTSTQGGQAQAEFTWRTTPTKIGEAFDPTSASFKALPNNLQRAVREPHGVFSSISAKSFGGVNRSVGIFRRYDDGWRLTAIQ
ncbi:MAG TPA: hypothetical protein VF528_20905 [Pyrinomonadaceae bacterium]|jgi:hypothetical protein